MPKKIIVRNTLPLVDHLLHSPFISPHEFTKLKADPNTIKVNIIVGGKQFKSNIPMFLLDNIHALDKSPVMELALSVLAEATIISGKDLYISKYGGRHEQPLLSNIHANLWQINIPPISKRYLYRYLVDMVSQIPDPMITSSLIGRYIGTKSDYSDFSFPASWGRIAKTAPALLALSNGVDTVMNLLDKQDVMWTRLSVTGTSAATKRVSYPVTPELFLEAGIAPIKINTAVYVETALALIVLASKLKLLLQLNEESVNNNDMLYYGSINPHIYYTSTIFAQVSLAKKVLDPTQEAKLTSCLYYLRSMLEAAVSKPTKKRK